MLQADGTPIEIARRFQRIRAFSQALADPLSEADAQAQSMPEASPTKWHLAHTTWFFETLFLERAEAGFRPHHPSFRVLFNSYYHTVGPQAARTERGLITRPGLAEVLGYRRAVDARVRQALAQPLDAALLPLVTLGLHHEQQHQELILTDIKHLLGLNPLLPAYAPAATADDGLPAAAEPLGWLPQGGGLVEIGHGLPGFAYDNECPRHRVHLPPYELANRLITEGEWAAFIDDGGYRDPRWWLSDGWQWVQQQRVEAPLYWHRQAQGWQVYTLHGPRPLQPAVPVLHLSYYEADAFARWAGGHWQQPVRLPTEAEWEFAAAQATPAAWVEAGLRGLERLHAPAHVAARAPGPAALPLPQAFGVAWQWTSSSYAAYPGYRAWSGEAGEYNGKFMVGQQVLRGGSFATPAGHLRASYRNFFPPQTRWQFSGLRLARDPG